MISRRCRALAAIVAVLPPPLAGGAGADSGPPPQIQVDTDRPVYQFGEPVWLYVRVANSGEQALAIENPYCSRTKTRIELTDSRMRMFPMSGPASCSTTILETIPAGEEMTYAFELLEFYGVDGGREYPLGILPPGDYQVRYRHHHTLSPQVAFTVRPLAPAQRDAFHAYVRLLSHSRGRRMSAALGPLRAYADRYPDTPFAPALLCRAGVLADLFFDSQAAYRDFRRLIRNYPNSGYVSVAIRHLAFGLARDRSEGIAFLAALPQQMPGTLAATHARRVVERLAAAGATPAGSRLD